MHLEMLSEVWRLTRNILNVNYSIRSDTKTLQFIQLAWIHLCTLELIRNTNKKGKNGQRIIEDEKNTKIKFQAYVVMCMLLPNNIFA